MKKVLPVFFFSIFLMTGCKLILLKMNGIKNPDVENEKSIKKAALHYELDTTNIVTVNSAEFLTVFKSTALPDAAIYNSKGQYIEYRATDTSCNAGLFEFIPNLRKDSVYAMPKKIPLKEELAKYRNLKGHVLKSPDPADFYVLIYWTAWTGKLNKNHVKEWEDLAKQNKNCKIKVIKVNLDMQEWWEKDQLEEIQKKLKK